jgi:membrane fusion protein (multidrug efflux system)
MMLSNRVRAALALLFCLTSPACQKEEQKAAPPPPPAVKVAEAVSRDVPIFVEAIGQTVGNTEIEISARVEGFLETMNYKEGTFVKKGQLLYTIDARPFRAAQAQAQADVAKSEAELVKLRQDVARYEPLVAKNAVSREDYETAVARERAQQSAVAASKAAAERARIEVGYTRVTAPDDGLIGQTQAYPGTLVGTIGKAGLTHISKVDPIHVRFSISERDYLFYARQGRTNPGPAPDAAAAADAGAPGSRLPSTEFQLILADGSVHSQTGKLVFVDRNVDAKTGTIKLEASFPNPGAIIRPGQYARVRAAVSFKKGAVLISQASVQELQGISNIVVVKADNGVEIRPITPAERVGHLLVVESGVKPGERVVVEGLQKIRPGIKVQPELVPLEPATAAPSGSAAGPAAPAPSPAASGG